ncbi:anti-sigma factor [Humisphaera borealis]|uniref:Uncharacterized protein n=1 Tax=Humisphaera borealis TaxID=2807512 RepID=A0A7M2WTM7_9BACT|nr:hypothetical protein [Humisphaera borealis]QOV88836.1 hypothetical protein IPV69_21815 [Humisphaera borealis]
MNHHPHPSSDDLPVDPDLALLESYLDGELSSAQLQSLQQRLAADADLSSALARLSEDFTVRQAVWTSLEGSVAESRTVSRQVVRSIRRAGFWERSRNYVRAGIAVAACLVCFSAGWIGRGSTATAAMTPGQSPDGAKAIAEGGSAAPFLYQVALTDEAGNITAIQKFDTLEDAKAFAAELSKWEAEQAQAKYGQTVLMQSGL